ncbi:MAG: hypothetical protein OES69_13045 [Myxococcales bacterium]|nr:hypothetical protein [Myxococcales bacterium]MDH3844863.1 hypothetical protein [Myxococcales bacterium]
MPATVLVALVQGASEVRAAYADRVGEALLGALVERGYAVVTDKARGEALVACGTLACVEQTLEGGGAAFGIVPAMWVRAGDRREVTLTLVGKSGRNLNAGTVIDGDLSQTTAALVDELLARRSELESNTPSAVPRAADEPKQTSARPHAWRAGPILLWAGGAVAFVGIGAAAGMKDETQELNKGAVVAWSVVGAAALAGGTAWWVLGDKRRRRQAERTAATSNTAIRVSPRGFDLRLRF